MRLKLTCKHCRRNVEIEGDGYIPSIECPSCHVTLNLPSNILDVDSALGGFKIIRHLGSGSMGCVYLAKQMSMDRDVAIKVLPPEVKDHEEELENFLKEVRLLAKLDHPNIVTAFEAGEANGNYYMAMTYVQGETLEDKIARDGPLAEMDALNVARKISEALKYAWEKHQILHRDVKPENIMVDERSSDPKLLDMGISKTLNDDSDDSDDHGVLVGTPHYMSPEQAKSHDIDFRSDMYSLGCSLFQFLTGKVPYDADTVMKVLGKHALDPVPNPLEFNSDLHSTTADLLRRMMAKRPDSRFDDWDELIKAIRHVMHTVKHGEKGKKIHVNTAKTRKNSPVKADREMATRADEVMARMHEDEFREEPPQNKLIKVLLTAVIAMLIAAVSVFGVMKLRKPEVIDPGDSSIGTGTATGDGKKVTDPNVRNKIEAARRKLEEKREERRREAQKRCDDFDRNFKNMVRKDPISPHSFDPTITQYRAFMAKAKDTPTEPLVKRHIDGLLARQAIEMTKAIQTLKIRAAKFIVARKYEDAIKVYKEYSGICTPETTKERNSLVGKLRKQQARQLESKLEVAVFVEKAANMLANARYEKAANSAKLFTNRRGEFGAEANMVCNVARMNAVVIDSFKVSVNKELTIAFRQKRDTVKITKVADGQIFSYKNIVFEGIAGKEHVNFKAGDLHSSERLKRLKGSVSPECYSFMKGLMAMELKKYGVAMAEFKKSNTLLGKTLVQYAEIKNGDPEEWAAVEFKMLLNTIGIKEAGLVDMNRELAQKTLSPVDKVRLQQAFDIFIFRFGNTEKAKEFNSFLLLLKDLLGKTEPIDRVKAEKVLIEIKSANRMKSLKSRIDPVVGGARLDLTGNPGLEKLGTLTELRVRELILRDTSFLDPATLANLPLRKLDLSKTPIKSLLRLKNTSLQYLSIASTKIDKLPNMRPFSVLCVLDASDTPLTSIRGLSGTDIEELNLMNCTLIDDLSPLFTMPNLRTLVVSKKVKGFGRLQKLTKLKRIGLTKESLQSPEVFWQVNAGAANEELKKTHGARVKIAIEQTIKKNGITTPLATILSAVVYHPTGVEINFSRIKELSDLSSFTGIPVCILKIAGTRVSDLSPFSNAPLEQLRARKAPIDSVDTLATCPLTHLDLRECKLDPTPLLKHWPHIVMLSFDTTTLSSLDLFRGKPIRHLEIRGGLFRDLSPLSALPLNVLRIEKAPVSDLSPLAKCDSLEYLYLPHTEVSDLGPLTKLSLIHLDISNTQVKSIRPIMGDPLTSILLNETLVTDISFLAGGSLTRVEIQKTSIADVSMLRNMPITRLLIGGTKIKDFSAIGSLKSLRKLWVDHTEFNDLNLLKWKPLKELRLDGCHLINNIELLGSQGSLIRLTIPRRGVRGLWALRKLEKLQRLNDTFDWWKMKKEDYLRITMVPKRGGPRRRR